jgi:hypothetical protein
MPRFRFIVLVVLLGASQLCQAQLKDENLLVDLPPGYKADHEDRQGRVVLTEMVPRAESVASWTEMLSAQIFLGLKTMTPDQYRLFLRRKWGEACKGATSSSITEGQENGYEFSLWVQSCPLNPATAKAEVTYFKALKGNDNFYVVQKAFRYAPTLEQVKQWMDYMKTVTVCDTRLEDRPCPNLKPGETERKP